MYRQLSPIFPAEHVVRGLVSITTLGLCDASCTLWPDAAYQMLGDLTQHGMVSEGNAELRLHLDSKRFCCTIKPMTAARITQVSGIQAMRLRHGVELAGLAPVLDSELSMLAYGRKRITSLCLCLIWRLPLICADTVMLSCLDCLLAFGIEDLVLHPANSNEIGHF